MLFLRGISRRTCVVLNAMKRKKKPKLRRMTLLVYSPILNNKCRGVGFNLDPSQLELS